MSSDYDRATVDTVDNRGRLKRTWDTLQTTFSQTVETVTRQARFEISGGGVDTVDAPDNLDELVDEAKKVGFVWRAFDIFANEVWEPGIRLTGPDETVAFFLGDVEDVDVNPPEVTPEGGFLENCGVHAGVKKSEFHHIGKQSTFQRRLRGTVLVELLKNDPDTAIPETEITGFNFVRPETVSAETYPYSNILIDPEDTDVDGVDITRRGEAAAYIQWEDSSILGRRRENGLDNDEVPLSKNDLKKQVLNPGIGDDASEEQGIFGTSEVEPISEDIAEYRQIKRDRATAIQNKAHGVYFIEHGRDVYQIGNNEYEIVEWDSDSMDDFESDLSSLEPGGYITHDASVGVERKDGDVPDLTDTMQQIINDIFAGLPVPKYKVGFEDDVNRDVTSQQSDDSERLIQEEREYQENWWTQQFKLVAQSWDLPTEGLQLKIEPEPEDSPVLSLTSEEVQKLNTYAQALNALAGPMGGPQTLVDTETLLTDVAQLPKSVNEVEDIDPEQTENPDAMQEFLDVMDADVETDTYANQYSEGDIVDTPRGVGVVSGVWTESWEDDGETIEASDDSPAYTVALEDGGFEHYKASDLSEGELDVDVDDPVEDLDAMADIVSATTENAAITVLQESYLSGDLTIAEYETAVADVLNKDSYDTLDWTNPESWRESETPARVIALKAWADMNGQFDCGGACCMGDLRDAELCASLKDYVLGTEAWRGWGPD